MACPECGATTIPVTQAYYLFGLKIPLLRRKRSWCLLCGHLGRR